jgi:hypothetical protein
MINLAKNFLESTGMWIPENKPKYDFRLSPEVFTITKYQITQLELFAENLRNFFETKTGKFPFFCKIDVMINTNGDLKIAEIDGLNKRAFGYAILERKIAEMFGCDISQYFSGIENSLKQIVGSKKLFLVVPGREKYYKYGFNILIKTLRDIGVDAYWGHEKEAIKFLSENSPDEVILLDCPKTYNLKLDELLQGESWNVLIPNEPFFSSKVNMVDFQNHLIPQTLRLSNLEKIPFEKYILKHIDKSGCKGIYFYDQNQEVTSGEFIVQELVEGKEFQLSYFEGTTLVKSEGWQVRLIVTLDLIEFKVLDVDVTARQDRLVHGSVDSIQIAGVHEK